MKNHRVLIVDKPKYKHLMERIREMERKKAIDMQNAAISAREIRTGPFTYDDLVHNGNAVLLMGNLPLAFAYSSHAISVDPDEPDAYKLRGILYKKERNVGASDRDFRTALEILDKRMLDVMNCSTNKDVLLITSFDVKRYLDNAHDCYYIPAYKRICAMNIDLQRNNIRTLMSNGF